MIENAEARTEDRFRDRIYDVCIVGSGPAGVTLARKLEAHGLSIGMFEGGDLEYSEDSQDIYRGETHGEPEYYPLEGCRLRFLGGSSNHWGGWTRPLDANDFEPNPNNPLSGWPIARSDLDPYLDEAADILNLTPDREPPTLFPAGDPDLAPGLFRFSRPRAVFGQKYRRALEQSRSIELFLNANLVDLRLDADRRSIAEAVFRSYERPEPFRVKARAYVLCLGGIENPRALLNANSEVAAGLGNGHDLVGRYFLEHPHAPLGTAVLRTPLDWMHVYSPTPAFMAKKGILRFGLRIGDFEQWNAGDFTGALEPAPACSADFDTLLAAAMRGEESSCPAYVADVFAACEQALDPDNRVRLIDERDRFGLRRIALDWSVSEQDLHTIRTAAETIAARLASADLGRMRIVDWLVRGEMPTASDLYGGNHHMGTTRMSDDPATGVVDAHSRVHSLGNLYVGGSSVFATSGHANPTLTIVQLALRLGDHLAARLRGG